MAKPVVVTIHPDGTVRFLVSEGSSPLLSDGAVVRRASHVEPVSLPLRWLFHGLRFIWGEYGWVAKFTRAWPCMWRINLAPIGGPVMPVTYRNRQDAIDREVEWLNKHFI